MKPHREPQPPKAKLYSQAHSSARKAVERSFAALFGQFEILARPARLSSLSALNDIVLTCIILRNMISEERGYYGTAKFRIPDTINDICAINYQTRDFPSTTYEQSTYWREFCGSNESLQDHVRLRDALMDHIWNTYGNEVIDES